MKGLYPATYDTLNDVIINGNWANYGGKIATLGLVSADDPELNYVQIPMESTQWADTLHPGRLQGAGNAAMFDGAHDRQQRHYQGCQGLRHRDHR